MVSCTTSSIYKTKKSEMKSLLLKETVVLCSGRSETSRNYFIFICSLEKQIPSLMKTHFFFNSTAASSPGMIAVKVQTSHGQYLGATVFTYVDEDQEVLRRLITSDRIQSKFFSFLAQELSIRESKTKQDETSKCSSECLDS